jgi:hypothetical protein
MSGGDPALFQLDYLVLAAHSPQDLCEVDGWGQR